MRRAAPKVLRHATHEEVRERLDRIVDARAVETLHHRALAPRHRVERADRPPARSPARQLRSTKNRRVLGRVRECVERVAIRPQLRGAADAARAEHRQARHGGAEEAAQPAEPEIAGTLDEERPPLVERGFEVGEIDDGRIDFHLSEVRIHGRVQREIRRQQDAGIHADAPIRSVRIVERIPRRTGDVRRTADDVWQQLSAARRARDHEPGEMSELRRAARFVELPERPLRQLVQPVFLPPDLQAPGLLILGRRESEL